MIKLIRQNLKGTFSWDKYVQSQRHSPGIGPNGLDFAAQMPVIGLGVCVGVFTMYYTSFGMFQMVTVPARKIIVIKEQINEGKTKPYRKGFTNPNL